LNGRIDNVAETRRIRQDRMTLIERMNALLTGQPIDRVPVWLWLFSSGFAALNVGYSLADSYNDSDKSFWAQLWTIEMYGSDDFPKPSCGGNCEAAWAFGGQFKWPTSRYEQAPSVIRHPVESAEDAQRLEFQDESFQVVTCFEVIEHVPKPHMLLSGIRRIVARDGVALLTTPNRKVRLLPLQRPWNREHLREYTVSAFQRVMGKHFPSLAILGIGGNPEPHEYYLELWRQSPWRVYSGWVTRPTWVLRRVLTGRRTRTQPPESPSTTPSYPDSDLLNMAVPAPNSESWPFYVGDVAEHSLNLFAVCGFHDGIVQRAAREIRGPGRR